MVGIVWVANALSLFGFYLYTQMDFYRFKDPVILNRMMWEWLQAFKLSLFLGLVFVLCKTPSIHREKQNLWQGASRAVALILGLS